MTTGQDDQEIRATNGDLLFQRRSGYKPLRFDDTSSYMRGHSVEIIVWLLAAASSGIVGNLAYDSLKGLVAQARLQNSQFYRTLNHWLRAGRDADRQLDLDQAPVEPDRHLRDLLILIAEEAVKTRRKTDPTLKDRAWSEVGVSYSKEHTWMVYIRERGVDRGFTVEIDLKRQMDLGDYEWVDEGEGFPVRIWL